MDRRSRAPGRAVLTSATVGIFALFLAWWQPQQNAQSSRGRGIAPKSASVLNFEDTVARPSGTTIHLPSGPLEPSVESSLHRGGFSSLDDGGYVVVQLATTANDAILEDLRAAGIEIIQYVPHNAFLAYASGSSLDRAADSPSVRWAGRYEPHQKVSNTLRRQLAGATSKTKRDAAIAPLAVTKNGSAVFDVSVFKRAERRHVAEAITAIFSGNVLHEMELPGNFFDIVRVELPISTVEKVAELPDVFRIDAWSRPSLEDERAARILAGGYSSPTAISGPGYNPLAQFGVDGTGVAVSVVDDGVSIPGAGGFYVTATNTVNAPLRSAPSGAAGGHGHLNASIIAGDAPFSILDGLGYNYGLGIAPKSNIINIPALRTGYTGSDADSYSDSVTTIAPNGGHGFISNNSWGNGLNGNSYDAYAAMFDGFVRDASSAGTIDPLVLVFSAGNDGASGITRPKVAKNVIAVGNSENIRPELVSTADNLDDIRSTSARGPAADGRVKPDIVAPGTAITGGRAGSCSSVTSCFDTHHAYSIGTSHAAPQVAGAAALFTQFWKNLNGGVYPSPALVKAALISTARESNGVGSGSPIPNGDEGWGRLNISYMLNTGVAMTYADQSATFTNTGQSTVYAGTVSDASRETRISLVWTDPPGAVDPALVNNLDLTVTVGGEVYRGNNFLNGSSIAGGSADLVNNVENVWLPAGIPAGTPIAIRVAGSAINGDGVLGNADPTDQHFAIIGYNVAESGTAVIAKGAVGLVLETQVPLNNAPDPGESVTVSLDLSNVGTLASGDLTATLLPTGGVTAPGPTQNYGSLAPDGSAARNFTFTAASQACGSYITLTWQLSDGAADLGTVSTTMRLGTIVAGSPVTFSNASTISIPAIGNATPYSSDISVSGLSPALNDLTVSLNNINHTWPADVDVLLVSPAGKKFILMSDVIGDLNLTGQSYTFDDDGAALLPSSGSPPASGIRRPTNYGTTDAFAAPAPASPYASPATGGSATLRTVFGGDGGGDPNGAWRLFVVDDATGDSGSIAGGWSMNLTPQSNVCSFAPTAAPVSISGQVVSLDGRGIRGAVVSIAGGDGTILTARTNTFGHFRLEGVNVGATYVLTAAAPRYTFSPIALSVTDQIDSLIVTANR